MDFFVAGTDTGVGKTVATAVLALALSSDDPSVAVIKPVQTGSPPDDDAAWVTQQTGVRSFIWECFVDPLAPAVCAEREGYDLDIVELAELTQAVEANHRICESAGGLLSPLAGTLTMADLAIALGWPIVLVARPGLGTLNHTALVVEAIERRALPFAGLVVSNFRGGLVEETNLARLEQIAPMVTVIPAIDNFATGLTKAALHIEPLIKLARDS